VKKVHSNPLSGPTDDAEPSSWTHAEGAEEAGERWCSQEPRKFASVQM